MFEALFNLSVACITAAICFVGAFSAYLLHERPKWHKAFFAVTVVLWGYLMLFGPLCSEDSPWTLIISGMWVWTSGAVLGAYIWLKGASTDRLPAAALAMVLMTAAVLAYTAIHDIVAGPSAVATKVALIQLAVSVFTYMMLMGASEKRSQKKG